MARTAKAVETTASVADVENLPPALVARMIANLREFAGNAKAYDVDNMWARCRDILAEIPDTDLREARRLVADRYDPRFNEVTIAATLAGEDDDTQAVQNCLLAIKRGRELEREQGA